MENVTQKKILSGLSKCEDLISSCYGPRGTSVLMESFGRRYLTKYGSQIMRELVFEDPVEDIARRCLADVAVRTESFCGDGTKTAILLQCSLYRTMRKLIAGGLSEQEIYAKVLKIKNETIDLLSDLKLEVDRDSLGDLLGSRIEDPKLIDLLEEAYLKAGKGTLISVGDSKGVDPYLELKEGYYTEDIMVNQAFFTKSNKNILEGCLVAVSHFPIFNIEDITPFLQFASKHPILIVAPFIDGPAFTTLMMNKEKGVVDGIAIGISSEDIRNDIAALTRSTILTRLDLKEDFDVELLGSCKEITVSKTKMSLSGRLEILTHSQHEPFIEEYLNKLRNEAANTESSFTKRNLLKRISKLSGGICQLKIGGFTELEKKDKRSHIEKALAFVNLSIKTGVVPGGNSSFIYVYKMLKERYEKDEIGSVCLRAFMGPLARLCRASDLHLLEMLERNKELFTDWVGIDVEGLHLEIRPFNSDPLLCDSYGGLVYILNIAVSSALELAKSAIYVSKKRKR